jgi:hypothetical protein
MLRILQLTVLLAFAVFICSCDDATVTVNTNGNTTVNINVNSNNLPPEFSTAPIAPSAVSTPGIPANGILPKGATPTPGIPPPSSINKRQRPGATPTPGIPDPETIRRQMQGLERPNMNAAPTDDQMRPMKKRTPQP